MIVIERTVDISKPIQTETLRGNEFKLEANAHTFRISVANNGAAVALTGSVSASMLLADGSGLTLGGSLDNGVAVLTLPQAAYGVPGRFMLAIYSVQTGETEAETVKTCIYACVGAVINTYGDQQYDPGNLIPDAETLAAYIEACQNATTAANTAAGRAETAALTAVTYAAQTEKTDAEKAQARTNIGAASEGDVSSLKSVKANYANVGFNQWDEEWEVGGINGTTGQNTVTTGTIRSKNYIPVVPGAKYYFKSPVRCWWHSYGADKSYMGVINYGSSFKDEAKTLGNGVYFLRFQGNAYGNTYNNDICVNLFQDDTSIDPHNGQYVPYSENFHVLNRLIDDEKNVNAISEKLVNGTLGFITPDMYGAVGDGETDDTTALKTMFSNSANVVVVFPKGKTYIISPDSESPSSAIFLLTGKVIIYGNGSTLKIANGSGGYGAIFGCSTHDVTGSMIDGLIFDHNSTNCQNFTVNSSNVLEYARITFAAEICYQFVFRNNVIKNCACTNCLYFNKGLTIKNILVDGNRFDAIGKTPNSLYHDHSSLYIHGDNIKIINNKFSGESWGAEGAATAIEVHPGNGCIIAHNTIERYLNGINYTAVNDVESANGLIDSNIFNTLRHAVIMYSSQFHDHITGYGINGLIISNNYIRIRNSLSLGYLNTNIDYGVGGIVFYHYTTLPIKDVYVTSNLLTYDVETIPGSGETPAHSMQYGAIGIFETSTDATLYEDVIFDNITLINPPGICIAIGASMLGGARGTYKNCRFSNITVVNPCGVPYQYSDGGQNYRRGISCGGTQFIGDLEIDVKFLDADYTKMRYPITLSSGSDSSNANINIRCSIKWSNAPVTGDYLLVTRYDNNTIPKAKIDVNSGSVVANVTKFKGGSCIANEATGKIYYMDTDGTTFASETASTLFEKTIIAELVRL